MKTILTLLGLMLGPAVWATEASPEAPKGLAKATFAAGCFWCVEPPFDKLDGVIATTSGYIGGSVENPSYAQITTGTTGHTEAVEVLYDPRKVSYQTLLKTFWQNVDPTTNTRQFCDSGSQYRPGIFWHSPEQKLIAERSREVLDASGRFPQPVKVEITPASTFYIAEPYHQDYYRKNTARYKYYRWSCGRDARLKMLWGDARN